MRSVEVARRGPRPPIRLRPAPAFEPPFDDEIEPQVWATAHQLALDWGPPARQSGASVTGSLAAHPGSGDSIPGTTPPVPGTSTPGTSTPGGPSASVVAGASAEARLAVRRFVSVCVEVLNGYRPAAHLRQLSVPGCAAVIVAQAIAATNRVADMRRASGRSSRGASRHGRRPDPVAVRGLRLCEPTSGVVEAAVVLITAERTWAVALRLERHQQSWSATTLRLV
jgi:hypothetical protein